jgi:hypothetical protein
LSIGPNDRFHTHRGGHVRPQVILALAIAATLWVSSGATAVVENVDDLFVVEYEPASFYLKPDEHGTLVLDVENISNETWMVALRFTKSESGYTNADIRPSLFELEANASQRVTISIQTHADAGRPPVDSDFDITMYWGKDIIQYENTWVDGTTVEGHQEFDFEVGDDISNTLNPFSVVLSIIIIMAVIIGVGLWVWRRKVNTRPN